MKPKERELALSLRRQGYSLNEICEQVAAAKSTVSIWVRGVELDETQFLRLKTKRDSSFAKEKYRASQAEKRLARWESYQEEAEKEYQELQYNTVFMFGLALYIGEGTKRDNNSAAIANADPRVIRKAIKFFELLEVPVSKIVYSIQTHKDNPNNLEEYWKSQTALPDASFRGVIVATSKGSYKIVGNTLPYGTCRLMVHSTELTQKIKRWMELALG